MSEYRLPLISYLIAYVVLPHYAYQDFEKARVLWTETPNSVGRLFYFTGCQVAKLEPRAEDAKRFLVEHIARGDSDDFYLMCYPEPPPLGLNPEDDVEDLVVRGEAPILAPHFSVIVRQRESGTTSYYVLGQSPFGGTTFRSVSADGSNANHGPGPEPQREVFLQRVFDQLSGSAA